MNLKGPLERGREIQMLIKKKKKEVEKRKKRDKTDRQRERLQNSLSGIELFSGN